MHHNGPTSVRMLLLAKSMSNQTKKLPVSGRFVGKIASLAGEVTEQ